MNIKQSEGINMKRLMKITGFSEGFLTLYFIILFLIEFYMIKDGVTEWYLYLIMIFGAMVLTFIVIIIHIVIEEVILDTKNEKYNDEKSKELYNLIEKLIKENRELKEQLNKKQ